MRWFHVFAYDDSEQAMVTEATDLARARQQANLIRQNLNMRAHVIEIDRAGNAIREILD